jgi:hypothetical protein
VSFSGDRADATPSNSGDSEPVQPEWVAPPIGVLPGLSVQRAVVFRTNDAMLIVHRFAAFPTGLEFDVDVYVRHGPFFGLPLTVHAPRYREGDQFTEDLIRFGVRFADGASWTNLDPPSADFTTSTGQTPTPPVVSCSGGTGGGHRISGQYWLWPLPPEGPLVFIAEWPAYDIPESSAAIDATELRTSATRSERLW